MRIKIRKVKQSVILVVFANLIIFLGGLGVNAQEVPGASDIIDELKAQIALIQDVKADLKIQQLGREENQWEYGKFVAKKPVMFRIEADLNMRYLAISDGINFYEIWNSEPVVTRSMEPSFEYPYWVRCVFLYQELINSVNFTLLGQENIGLQNAYVLKSPKMKIWVSEDKKKLLNLEEYDSTGQKIMEIIPGEYMLIAEKVYLPKVMTFRVFMEDTVRESKVVTENMQINTGIPEELFIFPLN